MVYLGDVITANNVAVGNASLYWDQALSPTRERGIPWATVFGNHDDAPFEWPLEWFSSRGIPHTSCNLLNSSVSGGFHRSVFVSLKLYPFCDYCHHLFKINSLIEEISEPFRGRR